MTVFFCGLDSVRFICCFRLQNIAAAFCEKRDDERKGCPQKIISSRLQAVYDLKPLGSKLVSSCTCLRLINKLYPMLNIESKLL